MKNFKYIIVIIILIIVILGVCIYVIQHKEKSTQEYEHDKYLKVEQEKPAQIIDGIKPENVKNINIYYTVKECISKYFNYILEKNTDAINAILESGKNSIEINSSNSIEYYTIVDMYGLAGDKYAMYYVKLNIDNNDAYIQVNLDYANQTYSIIELDRKTYENKTTKENSSKTSEEPTIKVNSYNKKPTITLGQLQTVNEYLKNYKFTINTDIDLAYDMLDDNYKSDNNITLEKFQEYVNKNRKEIEESVIAQYDIKYVDDKVEYICTDNNDNKFTFIVNYVMNYSIKPD